MIVLSFVSGAVIAKTTSSPLHSTPENHAESLKAIEQNITESQQRSAALQHQREATQQQIARLRIRSINAAKQEQNSETKLTSLQKDLNDLSQRSAESAASLQERRHRQADIVSALERVALLPPAALFFSSNSLIDTERSGILLSAMVPVLRSQTQTLAANLDELTALASKMDEKRHQLFSKQASVKVQRQQLDGVLAQRQALEAATEQETIAEQKRLVELSAQATSLRDLIQRIEQEQQEREARARAAVTLSNSHRAREPHRIVTHPAPLSAPAVRLVTPAAGQIVKQFGEGDDFSNSKGLTFQTSSGARIVSPFSGKIMFAGSFKGYGQILIIDHGGGYHALLAGLDRIHGVVGQSIVAGEPVGTMGTSGASPTLYLELRWQGQPIDPTPSLEKRD